MNSVCLGGQGREELEESTTENCLVLNRTLTGYDGCSRAWAVSFQAPPCQRGSEPIHGHCWASQSSADAFCSGWSFLCARLDFSFWHEAHLKDKPVTFLLPRAFLHVHSSNRENQSTRQIVSDQKPEKWNKQSSMWSNTQETTKGYWIILNVQIFPEMKVLFL